MSETSLKHCRICFNNNEETFITDAMRYRDFLLDIVILKDIPEQFMLCSWCEIALIKARKFIYLARESQEIFEYFDNTQNINIPATSIYKLTKCDNHNFTINTDNTIKENKLKIDKQKNRILQKYDQLQFNIKYLTKEDQEKEIEMKRNETSMNFFCENCCKGYLTEDVYNLHILRHTEAAGEYKCEICSLRFKNKEVLSHHSLSHKRRFTCRVCNAAFKRWSCCIIHRRNKCGTAQHQYKCEHCGKLYSDSHSRNVHIRSVHTTKHLYVCDVCKKSFKTKQRLREHIRIHTGIKPFSCMQCDKKFASNSNLRTHRQVHEVSKAHYCVECNKYYKTEKSLKRHFKESNKHNNLGYEYKCNECSKQFPSEKCLTTHLNNGHMAVHNCPLCNKNFSSNSNLQKHIRCLHAT